MKKATLASTAVWLVAALLMIGWQIVRQSGFVILNGILSHIMTWLCIGVLAASLGLMKSVDRRELFLSPLNTRARNSLNVSTFMAGVGAAFGFVYLAGAFGSVDPHSILFAVAVAALLAGTAFQATFAIVTKRGMSD